MKLLVPLALAFTNFVKADTTDNDYNDFVLLNNQSQIKSLLNPNKCWELTSNDKVRMRNCDDTKNVQKWIKTPVYTNENNQNQVKYQIKSQEDNTKCLAAATNGSNKRKLNLGIETCEDNKDSQCFKYEGGQIFHKANGKQYCLVMSGVVGKFLKKAYCPSTGFGSYDDSYNPTRPPVSQNCTGGVFF